MSDYDYGTDAVPPTVGIQWKGTDVCFDFRCECGKDGHYDGYFCWAIQCPYCGARYDMPYTLQLKPYSGTFDAIVVDE